MADHITTPRPVNLQNVTVKFIPHGEQRYPTVGDWVWNPFDGELTIYVSLTEDWRESAAVAVHEIVEALCCLQDHVDPDLVDSFDMFFEKNRKPDDDSEPGDDPRAPYYAQHQTATNVEHIVTTALGLHWPTYNGHLGDLCDEAPERGSESTRPHA